MSTGAVGTIVIGRYGFRGAKKELPASVEIKVVNCKKIGDDRKVPNLRQLKLAEIVVGMRKLYAKKFDAAVKEVVAEVREGRTVCCACMMGKNRSQAVALVAQLELAAEGKSVEVVYLGGLRATP